MARTVQVDLKAGVAGYIPPVEESKKATEGLKNEVQDLDRAVNKLPADAVKAAAALKLLGTEADGAGRKVAGVGDGSRSIVKLNDAIVRTRGEVRQLAEEFNRTGNTGILDQLFSAQKDLQALEGLSKRVSGALRQGSAEGGREGAKTFASGMQGGMAMPGLVPILVAAVVAAMPAINAALLGGLALGGIGLGIIGQLKSPAVRNAWADTGKMISADLTQATSMFEAPLVGAAHIIRYDIGQAIGTLHFDRLAQEVQPLATGLGDMVLHIVPGLNAALDAGAGILHDFARMLPSIGDAFGNMLRTMSQGSVGATEGLRGLVALVDFLLQLLGGLTLALSKAFEGFVNAGYNITLLASALAGFVSNIPIIGRLADAFHSLFDEMKNGSAGTEVLKHQGETLADALKRMEAQAASTTQGMDKLMQMVTATAASFTTVEAAIVGKVINQMMNLDQASLGVNESLTQLDKTMDKHNNSVDRNTEAGQKNIEKIYAAVNANAALYQAMMASGISSTVAADQYNANTAALEKQLHEANLTQAQIDGLIGKYRDVPGKVQTEIAAHGLTDVLNNLGLLIAKVYGLNGQSYGFTIIEHFAADYTGYRAGERSNTGRRWGGITEHAERGLLSAKVYSPMSPARYAFAEPATGGEAFVPRHGDYGRSMGILDQAARWYGGRVVAGGMSGGGGATSVNLTLTLGPGGGPADRALAQIAHYALRTGSLQLKAGNTPVTVG